MESKMPPKVNKQWLNFAVTTAIFLIVLNFFIFPGLQENAVTEVDYKTFATMVLGLCKDCARTLLVQTSSHAAYPLSRN